MAMGVAAQPAAAAFLEIRDAAGEVARVPLDRELLVIGRASDAEVSLASQAVSRRHAELRRTDDGGWRLRDLGSRNGTFIGGVRIEGERAVKAGEVVQIADFVLTLHLPSAAPPPPRQATTVEDTGALTVNTLAQVGPPKVDTRQLFALQRFGRRLIEIADDAERLFHLLQLVVSDDMRGTHAMAFRLDAAQPAASPAVLLGPVSAKRAAGQDFHVSRSVLDALRRQREPVLASNARGGARASGMIELSIAPVDEAVAVVACPLRQDAQTLDVLYVVVPGACGTGEWLALCALAAEGWAQAEAAWAARRQAEEAAKLERDLERARRVQMGLLPQNLDVSPALDVAIHFEPCHGVGGDYLDVLPTPDGKVLLAVADVCGKGMQAALISASVRTFVHAASSTGVALVPMMERLNTYLAGALPLGSFVTMVALLLDPQTGEATVVNAGHPPPILLQGGQCSLIEGDANLPLGIDERPYAPLSAKVSPGDLVALYTDGLTEIMLEGQKWLGCDGLAAQLADAGGAGGDCQALSGRLAEALQLLQRGLPAEDDQTFLLARRMA